MGKSRVEHTMRELCALLMLALACLAAASDSDGGTNSSWQETAANFSGWTTGWAGGTPAPPVVRNVTLSGLGLTLPALVLPSGWSWSWVWEGEVETDTGVCPAGRYCPVGAGAPVRCPLGTYSPSAGRTGMCQQPCGTNRYCPDPAVEYECPAHTSSARGSTSQLECLCDQGYQCVYRRQVNLNVLLPMTLGAWNGNAALKEALVAAVAASGGVGVGSVVIESVTPVVSGGGRRMLSLMRTLTGTELRIAVRGAERLKGLEDRLRAGNSLLRRAETRWQRAHQIRIRRFDDDGGMEFA